MNAFASPSRRAGGTPISVIILNDHGWVNGGQAKVAIESAIQLKRAGLDVAFLAGTGPLDERLVANGIECHVAGDHDILSDPRPPSRRISRGVERQSSSSPFPMHRRTRKLDRPLFMLMAGPSRCRQALDQSSPAPRPPTSTRCMNIFSPVRMAGFFNYRSGEICRKRALGLDCLTSRCDVRNDLHKAWRVARQLVLRTAGRLPRDLREIIYLSAEQKSIMAPYISSEARWHHLPNPVSKRPAARVPPRRTNLPFRWTAVTRKRCRSGCARRKNRRMCQ